MNIRVKLTKSANYNHYKVSYGEVIQLDLEEYLRGVVPSECYTSWSQNTLKAQAVAARSYAIVMMNRASGNYHVDDTTAYQSFNITNKTTSTTQAVDATAGIVLKYGNSVAETVYCASNGGRCYSAVEAGWYKTDYLVSKNDPWTAATGKPKDGHGVGLSQWGAYYAGSIGTSYQTILDFYFPGTTITTNYGNGGSPDPGTSNVGKTGTVVVNSAGLNVRSSPNGALLSYKLYNGERITVLEEETAGGYNWFRVQDEQGRTNGWVRSDFITLDEGGGSSGYATWQEKYGDNTFVTSNTYSGNVYRFQVDLNKWRAANGYAAIDADGLWGSASAAATKVFQQAFSDLDADGLCGPASQRFWKVTKQRQNDDITVTCIKCVILPKNNTDIDRPSQNIKYPSYIRWCYQSYVKRDCFTFNKITFSANVGLDYSVCNVVG